MKRRFGFPVINDVTTGSTPAYPDIQPLHVDVAAERVFAAVCALAGERRGWRRLRRDDARRELRAEAVTRLFRFVDDVHVWVAADGSGAVVHMRSKSRVGRGDLGANARRIRAFLSALRRRLAEKG